MVCMTFYHWLIVKLVTQMLRCCYSPPLDRVRNCQQLMYVWLLHNDMVTNTHNDAMLNQTFFYVHDIIAYQ